MQYYNLSQAARILGVSDKTMRGWLEKGRYPGAKKRINGAWSIPASVIDPDESIEPTGVTDTSTLQSPRLLQMLDVLAANIRQIEARLDALERWQRQHEESTPPTDIYSAVRPPTTTKPTGSSLPSGYVPAKAFIVLHGIPETTGMRYVTKSNCSMSGDWHDERGHIVKISLSPEQQVGFYRSFSGHEKFRPCKDCPHVS